MATMVTQQGILHFETYGRGRPVLLLHGWLGSWALWRNSFEVLGQSKYQLKVYALDFFGFGESSNKSDEFSVRNFVNLVNEFMDRQGIQKAALVGHSMGGTVSLTVAIEHPERVAKAVVIGSPVNGASLSWLLKLSGNPGFANLIWTFPNLVYLFLRGYSYFMANDGAAMEKMVTSDLSKVSVKPFFQSIATLGATDLRQQVEGLTLPVMGIYGPKDIIVSPNQAKVLKKHIPHARVEWFENSGHFPMMDEPERFHTVLVDFLNN